MLLPLLLASCYIGSVEFSVAGGESFVQIRGDLADVSVKPTNEVDHTLLFFFIPIIRWGPVYQEPQLCVHLGVSPHDTVQVRALARVRRPGGAWVEPSVRVGPTRKHPTAFNAEVPLPPPRPQHPTAYDIENDPWTPDGPVILPRQSESLTFCFPIDPDPKKPFDLEFNGLSDKRGRPVTVPTISFSHKKVRVHW